MKYLVQSLRQRWLAIFEKNAYVLVCDRLLTLGKLTLNWYEIIRTGVHAMGSKWMIFLAVGFVLTFGFSASGGEFRTTLLAQSSAREQAKAKKKEGDSFFRSKKYKKAEAAYREAIELDKGWYKSYEALGNLQFSLKRYADAIESFMRAVEVEPRYHTGLYNIAFAYRKSRNYAKAVEYYLKYIEKNSSDPDAFYGLASSYESMGKKREAMESYLKYAEMEKRPSERKYVIKARNKAEKLRLALGQDNIVTKPVAKPESKPPVKPALAKKTSGTKPAASTQESTAKNVAAGQTPDKSINSEVAGWIADGDKAMAEGKYTIAMKRYFDAARAQPRNTEAVYKLGLVYEKTGNSRAAELKWRTVLKIDPNHQAAKQSLARLSRPKEKIKPKPVESTASVSKPVVQSKPVTHKAPVVEPKPAPKEVTARPSQVTKPVRDNSKLTPDQRKALKEIEQGDSLFKQRSFAKAIAKYTHATMLDNNNEQALFKLATAYAYAGNMRVAIYKWKQVLKLNPNNKAAARNIQRAEAKLAKGSHPAPASKAKQVNDKHAKAVAKPKPGSFDEWVAKAQAAKKRGDAKGVLKAANAALRIRQDASVTLLKGEALVILKRFGEAKKAFSRAMILDPNLAAPFYGLGEACRLTGEKDRAKYYFKMYVLSKAKDVKPSLVKRARNFLSNG